jgi:hypothetical protein
MHLQHDFTSVGELHRVAEDIEQHLAETADVAKNLVGNVGMDMTRELESFFRGSEREHLGRVTNRLA